MGASSGIFKEPEVAVMVTVVLLTTLLTPLIMRGAFAIKAPGDTEDGNGDSPDFDSVAEFRAEA